MLSRFQTEILRWLKPILNDNRKVSFLDWTQLTLLVNLDMRRQKQGTSFRVRQSQAYSMRFAQMLCKKKKKVKKQKKKAYKMQWVR